MIALITGCSSGMGRALCQKMMEKGFKVIATARNISSMDGLEADIKLELDVTDEKSIRTVVNTVQKKYGHIDILVNNAGFSTRGALEEISVQKVQDMFDVNVFGMIRMIQAFSKMLRESKNGKLINIGSVSGRYTQAANGCYCASKHAVEAISEAARYELSPFGVQVTVIEPGPIDTNFFQKVATNSDTLMNNSKSPYYNIYSKNIKVRDRYHKQCYL